MGHRPQESLEDSLSLPRGVTLDKSLLFSSHLYCEGVGSLNGNTCCPQTRPACPAQGTVCRDVKGKKPEIF